mgnify:CR=1 FL=1
MYIEYKHQHFKEYFKLSEYLLLLFLTYSTILTSQNKVNVGAERPELYLNTLLDKRVGVVANQTSKVKKEHLVDVLLNEGVNVIKVFSPEHGFRGKSDAGEKVKDEFDLMNTLRSFKEVGVTSVKDAISGEHMTIDQYIEMYGQFIEDFKEEETYNPLSPDSIMTSTDYIPEPDSAIDFNDELESDIDFDEDETDDLDEYI